jgi:hypothetical protein
MTELERAMDQALDEMEAIPFFPVRDQVSARGAILRGILRFCDRIDALRWLTDTAVERMRTWQGVGELRALYCTRYPPADGQPAPPCTIPGFTAEDNEAAFLELQARETERKLTAWRREAAALPAAEREATQKLLEAIPTEDDFKAAEGALARIRKRM